MKCFVFLHDDIAHTGVHCGKYKLYSDMNIGQYLTADRWRCKIGLVEFTGTYDRAEVIDGALYGLQFSVKKVYNNFMAVIDEMNDNDRQEYFFSCLLWVAPLLSPYFSTLYRTNFDSWKWMLHQNGLMLQYLPFPQTPELCLLSVRDNGLALQFVREQTLLLCRAAVERTPLALACAKFQDEEMCIAAIMSDPLLIRYVKTPSDKMKLAARRLILLQAKIGYPLVKMYLEDHPDFVERFT